MVRCFMEGMSVKEKITQGSCFLLTGALGWMSPELLEAPLMSKLNGSLRGKFLFQKQVFEMRVPLGKLIVVGTPPSLMA